MSATAKIYPIEVSDSPEPIRRITYPDIEEVAAWVAFRLGKRSDLATPQAVKTWLRSVVTDNDTWFVRAGLGPEPALAIAMARLVRMPLAAPRAEEVFVLWRDGGDQAAADLYVPMAKWAVNLDCIKLDVDLNSDVPAAEIIKRLGPLKQRTGKTVFF